MDLPRSFSVTDVGCCVPQYPMMSELDGGSWTAEAEWRLVLPKAAKVCMTPRLGLVL